MTPERDAPRPLADLAVELDDPGAPRHAEAIADPRAPQVLDALDATRTELRALGSPPVPAAVAARWSAALESERVAGEAPRLRGRAWRAARSRWIGAALAAACVTGAVAAIMIEPADEVLELAGVDLAAAATSTVGMADLGPLAEPRRRAECLASAGAGSVAGDAVLGGRQVLLDGEAGTLLVLTTGELGRFRVLVVDPACRTVLADTVTGG